MKIVVALDSFKGSLTAVQACEIVVEAIRATVPGAEVVAKPMADGGEGTAAVLMAATGGQWVGRTVMGPLPEMQVEAGFVWLPATDATQMADGESAEQLIRSPQSTIRNQKGAALVEMATASGLPLLRPEQRNPLRATTYGTGELIRAAIDCGADHILLAIGGSATVDGGVGAAMALGWKFLAEDGREIGLGGGQLMRIARIVPPDGDTSARASQEVPGLECADLKLETSNSELVVEVLCDVDNPLTGEHGAARVFGPQKGATPEMVGQLDAGLAHLARLVREQLGRDITRLPGAGAAGGLAAGAVAFHGARLASGIEAVMAQTYLREAVADADWVLTGEGCFDA